MAARRRAATAVTGRYDPLAGRLLRPTGVDRFQGTGTANRARLTRNKGPAPWKKTRGRRFRVQKRLVVRAPPSPARTATQGPNRVVNIRVHQRLASQRSARRIKACKPPERPARAGRSGPAMSARRVVLTDEAIANDGMHPMPVGGSRRKASASAGDPQNEFALCRRRTYEFKSVPSRTA
jgi:hypothetical protein